MKKHLPLVSSLFVFVLFILLLILISLKPFQGLQSEAQETFDSPDEAQQYYLQQRVPYGATILPSERYLAANEQMKKMAVYSTATNSFASSPNQLNLGSWTSLGPTNIGGRTRALLIDPNNPNIMYAGGVAGGIWKTTDGGSSWNPKGDLLPNIGISSLARVSDGRLYAGTGELYPANLTIRGLGIYQSTDSGETWSRIPGTETRDFSQVGRIVVSPSNPRVIYAATNSGLWQLIRKKNKETYQTPIKLLPVGSADSLCHEIVVRTDQPFNADTVFAVLQGKIWRSPDGGTNWSVVSDSGSSGSRISMAIAPSNQSYIYAMSEAGFLSAFLRSTDNGSTWQTQVQGPFNPANFNTALLTNSYGAFCASPSYFRHQGNYDNCVAVDPIDANKVWAGGIDLFRSDNGGISWGLASYWWAPTNNSHYAHADQHIIVFHPQYNGTSNKIMYVGNDGGIFSTDDALASVSADPCNFNSGGVNWASLNNGYGVTQFYHGLPHPGGNTYFGGTQDNGTIQGADSTGTNSWTTQLGGDGGYVAITPAGDTRYAEVQQGFIYKSQNGNSYFYTGNNGIDETLLPFITTFVMDPNNSQRLWLGGAKVWRTDNGASNWSQAGQGASLDNFQPVRAITVDPGNSNRVFVGTIAGNIYYTNNGNASSASQVTWTKINKLRFLDTIISGIAFDPNNTNTVYVTYSNFKDVITDQHIYKSTNGGQTWIGLDGTGSGAIPDVPVHCVIVDPANSQRLYIGTDVGVFVSVDGGTTWGRENTGFANAPTVALSITNFNGNPHLFAFTHGRGTWRVQISSGGGGGNPPVAPSNLTATAVSSSQINLAWQDNSDNETGFRIERSLDGINFSLLTMVAANTVSYPNTELAANTRYYYRIKALNSSLGDSGFSNTADATTLQQGSPPAAPVITNIAAPLCSQINLTWQDNSNNEEGFRIERRVSNGSYATLATVAANMTSYSDTMGVQANTQYFYRLKALNSTFGDSPYSNEVSITTPGCGGGGNTCVTVSLLSGSGAPGYIEGVGSGAQWNGAMDGAVAKYNSYKTLFVADTDNHKIRLVYLEGPNAGLSQFIAGLDGGGYNNKQGKVRYNAPRGIAALTDANGNLSALVIADTGNHMIRKLTPPTTSGGLWTASNLGGQPFTPGANNGDANVSTFNAPQSVTIAGGYIYVADTDNNLIRKVTQQGFTSTLFSGSVVGIATPTGISISSSGLLYIADADNHSIYRTDLSGSGLRIAGTLSPGSQDGTGTAASFNKPYHLVWCNTSNGEMLYIADRLNHRIRRLAITSSAVITIAGTSGGDEDGDCTRAKFRSPRGVAAAADGAIYIMDTANHKLRKAL